MKRSIPFLLFILWLLLASACAGDAPDQEPLRIAVLPILDSLPIFVAEQEGFFAEQGVTVELIPVASAPERDQFMQAGQIDGMINELVSTFFYNQDEIRISIVRLARVATAEAPVFRILAAADSGIENPEDLIGVPIGISEGTVIEYTTDRMLEAAGLRADQIERVAVPKISDRFALLQSGQLSAANLPDPLASLAIQNGAHLVIDDRIIPSLSNSVLSFRVDVLQARPEAVRAFLRALEQAVEAINQDQGRWGDLLSERELVPPPLLGSYQIPAYPIASVPSPEQFSDALQWAVEKELVHPHIPFEGSVTDAFLP